MSGRPHKDVNGDSEDAIPTRFGCACLHGGLRRSLWVRWVFAAWITAALFLAGSALAEQRFPPPDFEGGHKLPATTIPGARSLWLEYLDVGVLAASLALATWIIYRKRSREALVWLSLFSVTYFGFWRKGCICSIGSIQNVSLAFADPAYALPLSALAFFVLPLAFSLFVGRSFCAGVCPHGALQDLVLIKPIKLPAWLEHGLGILPFVYLGAAVLFAATGSAFLVCQYDPFIPVFRMSGRTLMVLSGVALLVLGLFVGRPYCRFLCPYGALLKLGSTVSKWRVRVTPDVCTQCRLCEASCPFGAMRTPQPNMAATTSIRPDRRRLSLTLVLVPLLLAGGAFAGWKFAGPASRLHPNVALAERLIREQNTPAPTGVLSPDDLALDRARQAPQELLSAAASIRNRFLWGGVLFGAWVGLVIGAKLISLALHRRRSDYEPDRGECFSCARCFEYCPNELIRRGIVPAATTVPAEAAAARSGALAATK